MGARGVGGGGQRPLPHAQQLGSLGSPGAGCSGVLDGNRVWGSHAPSCLSVVAGGAAPVIFGHCILQGSGLSEENSTY